MGKSSLLGSSYSLCTMAATSYTPPFAFRPSPGADWKIVPPRCHNSAQTRKPPLVRGGGCPKGGRRGSLRYLSPTASRSPLVRGGLSSLHRVGSLPLRGRYFAAEVSQALTMYHSPSHNSSPHTKNLPGMHPGGFMIHVQRDFITPSKSSAASRMAGRHL